MLFLNTDSKRYEKTWIIVKSSEHNKENNVVLCFMTQKLPKSELTKLYYHGNVSIE